jgi:hypothetical protein
MCAGAGAASKCHPLATATFTDPSGDGQGANAPDITGVTVTSDDEGGTSFQIGFVNTSEFSTDMLVRTYIDADRNAATGDGNGFEYMIESSRVPRDTGGRDPGSSEPSGGNKAGEGGGGDPGSSESSGEKRAAESGIAALTMSLESAARARCENQPSATLFKWNGSAWDRVETRTLSSWYGDGTLNLRINTSELGDALAFDFAVYAAANVTYDDTGAPVSTDASYDWAPDTGTYDYQPFKYGVYSDPAGDGQGENAPDITKVIVTEWASNLIKFWVAIPNAESFGEGMLVRTYIDADSSSSTGDSNGYDYMIQAKRAPFVYSEGGDSFSSVLRGISRLRRAKCHDEPSVGLFRWSDSGWTPVETGSLNWSYDRGLTVAVDAAAIGNPTTFNFAVYAASKVIYDLNGNPVLTNASYDWAPDTGSFAFPSAVSPAVPILSPLPVSAAQFRGVYKVRYRILHSHNFGDMRRGKRMTRIWKFMPSCPKGKCKTTKVVVAGSRDRFRLIRKGKTVYKARAGRRYACDAQHSTRGTAKLQVRVKKSGWIQGKWRVTRWVGSVHVVSPGNGVAACGGTASYTASLTGTLK